jgi:Flp pilus assembly protein TadG
MRSVRRGARNGRGRSRGQSLVEFAIVFPFFVLLLAAVIDFGLGLYSYLTIINAAREGSRLGATECSVKTCEADIKQRVHGSAAEGGLDVPVGSVGVWCNTGSPDAAKPATLVDCNTLHKNLTAGGAVATINIHVEVGYTYSFIFRMPFPLDKMTSLHMGYRMTALME